MRLSKTDQQILLDATSPKLAPHSFGRVSADTLETKRKFNSLAKMKEVGLVEGKVTYESQSGYHDPHFGRGWCAGKSWSEFSGSLTSKGIATAKMLRETNKNK